MKKLLPAIIALSLIFISSCSDETTDPNTPETISNISKSSVIPEKISEIQLKDELVVKFDINNTIERKLSKSEFEAQATQYGNQTRLHKTTSESVFYDISSHPVGDMTSFEDLIFTGDAYSSNHPYWGVIVEQGATITLPKPAESFTIYPWIGYEYYGHYAPEFAAYDVDGNLLGHVAVSPYLGYGITPIEFTPSDGKLVKSIFLTGEFVYTDNYPPYYPFTYWFHLDVNYFSETSCEAPELTVNADITEIWPPNNKEKDITFSGININECGEAAYALTDEYGEYSYSGTLDEGDYSFTLPIKASCKGKDKDGRKYTLTVTSSNESGSVTQSVDVTVLHDKR